MTRLRPFISFYGAKWRLAPHYPAPRYNRIIEPFAGSACYSILHHEKDVVLFDRDPVIVRTWRYLISATPADILALPNILPGQSVRDLDVCFGAKLLIGWWLNFGGATPCKTLSAMGRNSSRSDSVKYANFWGPKRRGIIAGQVAKINHWTAHLASYENIENESATWFVDPPYQRAGKYYRYSKIDYDRLAEFCWLRRGEAMVCEAQGADWFPFEEFRTARANHASGKAYSQEVFAHIRNGSNQ